MRKLLVALTVSSFSLIGCATAPINTSNIPISKTRVSLKKANSIVENFDKCIGNFSKGILGDGKACYETAKNVKSISFKSILLKTACKLGEKDACKDAKNLLNLSKSECSKSIYDEYCRAYIYLADRYIDTSKWEFPNFITKRFYPNKYSYVSKSIKVLDKADECFKAYQNGAPIDNKFTMNCKIGLRYLINSEQIFNEVVKYETALDISKVYIEYPYTKEFKSLTYDLCKKTHDPEFCYVYSRILEEKWKGRFHKSYYDIDASLCINDLYMPSCVAITRAKWGVVQTNPFSNRYPLISYKFENKEADKLLEQLKEKVEAYESNIPILLLDGYSYNLPIEERPYELQLISIINPKPLRESHFLWKLEYTYRSIDKMGIKNFKEWCNVEIKKCDVGVEKDALKCKLTDYCKSLLH